MMVWLSVALVTAQTDVTWQQLIATIMTEDDDNATDWEEMVQRLEEMAGTRRDINQMTRDDWEDVPFLSPLMAEQLVEYHDRYGDMKSMNELRMLTALDEPRRQLLQYFFYIDDTEEEPQLSLSDIANYGKHELMGYCRVPCYSRRGDDNGYAGYPYKHWLRYQFSYHDRVKAGIVGSQDAGEPFLSGKNSTGYDFYSMYVQLNHIGRLETAVVGKYKLSAGMGLVLNNGFTLGKLATLSQLGRTSRTVRAHSSRSTDYMQGAAATIRIGRRLTATAFASYRPLDATLNGDGTVRTLVTNGYHRTVTELNKKNNTHATEAGANIMLRHNRLYMGATAIYSLLDRELTPPSTVLYRRYDAQGDKFLNVGINYGYLSRRLTVGGETAMDKNGAVATINNVSAMLFDGLTVTAVQRFYSYRYTALHARSLSNGGQVKNESGLMVGLTWTPSLRWRVMAYSDVSHSPWARYRVSRSSTEWDHLLQATYNDSKLTIGAGYRLRQRQRDKTGTTILENHNEQRGRLWTEYKSTQAWSTKSQIDVTTMGANDRGFMLSQTGSWQLKTLRLSGGVGYFHTDSYDSRVYMYEQGPLYTFGIGQFSGCGIRCWLMAKWQVNRRLTMTAKAGTTSYNDRDVIGTGLQQVDASSMTDIDLQVRWKL